MIILEFLYMCLGYLYTYTIIFFTSIVFNLYYFLRFYSLGLWNIIKHNIDLFINHSIDVDDVLITRDLILPKYEYDPFGGVLNWFSMVKITYGRTLFCDDEKHSKDCREFASILRYFFKRCLFGKDIIHNGRKKRYYKGKIITLLSMKPFIKHNHTIYLAYWGDSGREFIDIYSPYKFLITIRKCEYKNIHNIIEGEIGDTVYNRFYINNLF